MRYLIFLLFLLLLDACRSEPDGQLRVLSDQVSLRDTAGLKSREILFLKKGTGLKNLGQVSTFESVLEWNGKLLQSPWIRVEADGRKGWVLAALVSAPETDYDTWFEHTRMLCYFGDQVTQRRDAWLRDTLHLDTDARVAASYLEAVALRDTFLSILSGRAETIESAGSPDYSWLRTLLPGFVMQKLPSGTLPYYLFIDYNYWLGKAASSNGKQDDVFFAFCADIFPYDKVESFFPVWAFQMNETTAASQLGSGSHLKMLTEIEKHLPEMDFFRADMLLIQSKILEDIASGNAGYWQSGEKILAELKKIEESNFSSLEERDRLMIRTRYQMFEDPAANGIRVNLRSGE